MQALPGFTLDDLRQVLIPGFSLLADKPSSSKYCINILMKRTSYKRVKMREVEAQPTIGAT